MTSKAGVFRVSLEPVLGLLSEHLYQRPELFLRELICNSYDAVILRTETHNGNIEDQNIEVQCDGRKCLSIKDGGVGMSESELERFLANVGSSATKDAKCYQQSVIGEFGLGFLSVLAVAESVEVVTRRAGENDAYRWVWQGGTSYRIEHAGRVDVGTTVRVRFRSQHCHFADAQVVSELVCRYVPYLAIGIRINQLADPRTTPAAWKGQDTGRWGLPP